jgi:hypothetical protein
MIPRTGERPKTIFLKGQGYHEEGKAKAGSAILPGHLLEVDSTSTDLPRSPEIVDVFSTSGGADAVRVAKEDFLRGRTIHDVYAAGDIVPYHHCVSGDVVMLRVADNFSADPGALLKAHTDGTVIAHGGSGTALFELMEVVDFSGTGTGQEDVTELMVRAVRI